MSHAPDARLANEDERVLAERIAGGDRQAFNTLARLYAPVLLGYATRLLRSRDMAEDVVQEVLFRVWDRRAALRECASVRAYLLGAVRNSAFNALKHARVEERWETAYEREETPPGMGLPPLELEDALLQNELTAALLRAVDTLPERRRQILLLRLQQLTYGEIAEIMSISPKTVEAQITQAFAALRDSLGRWAE